MFFLT